MGFLRRWRRGRALKRAIALRERRRRARKLREAWDLYVNAPTYREARQYMALIIEHRP